MSTLSNKRRKVNDHEEYGCSENSDGNCQDSESKQQEEVEDESKSDVQSSTISQENQENARASGLVRRRKKKVLDDYYYGDEIFTKPKNGNKKKIVEKKHKKVKNKREQKINKAKKKNDVKTTLCKVKIKEKNLEKNLEKMPQNQNVPNIPSMLNSLSSLSTISNTLPFIRELTGQLQPKENIEKPSVIRSSLMPIKPIPKRNGTSNIDYLMGAYFQNSNSSSLFAQKREETNKSNIDALSKTLSALLANVNDSKMNGLDLNFLPKIIESGENRKSSSEMEDNLNHKTPTKQKKKRSPSNNFLSYSGEKKQRDTFTPSKKFKNSAKKTPRKDESEEISHNSDFVSSRVKETIKEGAKVKLVLETTSRQEKERSISFSIPSRNIFKSFPKTVMTPNLNTLFGITSSADSIYHKIKSSLKQSYTQSASESMTTRPEASKDRHRLTSIPLLSLNDLR